MKKYLLILLAVTALTLSACSFSKSKIEGPKATQTKPSTPDSYLDDQLFNTATSAGDLKKCEKILDSQKKKDCKEVVNSMLAQAQALNKMDKSKCKTITLERYKENCESEVAALVENKEADAKRLEIEQEAVNKQDQKICDQIKDENQKASCKYNVIANQAVTKKDSSLCEEIGQKDMIDNCKNRLK